MPTFNMQKLHWTKNPPLMSKRQHETFIEGKICLQTQPKYHLLVPQALVFIISRNNMLIVTSILLSTTA